MPWSIAKKGGRYYVRDKNGQLKPKGGYGTRAQALAYLKALYANAGEEAK